MTNDAKNKLAARKAKCFAILIAGGKRKMADVPQTIRQEVESKCAEYIAKKIPNGCLNREGDEGWTEW